MAGESHTYKQIGDGDGEGADHLSIAKYPMKAVHPLHDCTQKQRKMSRTTIAG